MQLFSRHMSSDVAQDLWQNRDEFLDGGASSTAGLLQQSRDVVGACIHRCISLAGPDIYGWLAGK